MDGIGKVVAFHIDTGAWALRKGEMGGSLWLSGPTVGLGLGAFSVPKFDNL